MTSYVGGLKWLYMELLTALILQFGSICVYAHVFICVCAHLCAFPYVCTVWTPVCVAASSPACLSVCEVCTWRGWGCSCHDNGAVYSGVQAELRLEEPGEAGGRNVGAKLTASIAPLHFHSVDQDSDREAWLSSRLPTILYLSLPIASTPKSTRLKGHLKPSTSDHDHHHLHPLHWGIPDVWGTGQVSSTGDVTFFY